MGYNIRLKINASKMFSTPKILGGNPGLASHCMNPWYVYSTLSMRQTIVVLRKCNLKLKSNTSTHVEFNRHGWCHRLNDPSQVRIDWCTHTHTHTHMKFNLHGHSSPDPKRSRVPSQVGSGSPAYCLSTVALSHSTNTRTHTYTHTHTQEKRSYR